MKRFFALLMLTILGALGYQWRQSNPIPPEDKALQPTQEASVIPKVYAVNSVLPSENISDMAETAVKSVVNISSVKIIRYKHFSPFGNDPFFQQFFGESMGVPREKREQSMGSGVIVDKAKGLILTNNHVIEKASEVTVTLSDQTQLQAKLVGKDPQTDLAVIKVKLPPQAQAMKIGNSDPLRLAETVLAIGSPFGLGGTVTLGIVSAKGRTNVGIVDYEDFIQTDAAINPGNSGGALVNLQGELVGINTAIYSKSGGYQGIGFAIPINLAQNIMNQLIEKGRIERGWIGLEVQDLNEDICRQLGIDPKTKGVIITAIYEGSPAHRARLEPYMIVTQFNDQSISNMGDYNHLLFKTPIGGAINLKVIKDKSVGTVSLQMESVPSS